MMKKTKDSSGAGETHVSPGSIIAMGKRSVNRFPPFESSPIAGIGDLERGYRVVWMCRNCADQCSSRTRAGTRRTSGRITRLREWYLDAKQKSGKKRRELDVTTCFAPLLRWALRLWKSETKQVALVIDATTLGNRWTILAGSRVVRGCAIPVAWKVLRAEQKGSWRPYWEELLTCLQEAVPKEWQVLVLADRGLYARWLWETIRACGWHPFLRLNLGVKARLVGEPTFEWISRWMPTPGMRGPGRSGMLCGQEQSNQGNLVDALGSGL
jgi:hypothetical protein